MRVLLTGASSFTGYWFARELAAANPGGAYEVRPVRLFLPGEPGVGAT